LLTLKLEHYQVAGKPAPVFNISEPYTACFDCSITIHDHDRPIWARGCHSKRSARAEAAKSALVWLQSNKLPQVQTPNQQSSGMDLDLSSISAKIARPTIDKGLGSDIDHSAISDESAIDLLTSSVPS
jgi:hypothetical protein